MLVTLVHCFIFAFLEKLEFSYTMFTVTLRFEGGDVVLRFGRQRDRSAVMQITQLLALSSSGPAHTAGKAAESVSNVRLLSLFLLYTKDCVGSLFRPTVASVCKRSLN